MANQDQTLREMLRDLGRALSEAISDSSEISATLRRIRREGYSLHLLLDCKREEDAQSLPLQEAPVQRNETRAVNPRFQINAIDLSFLRSIGIDPTRKMRPRRLRGSRR
jgi:hypothetical protein